MRFLSSLVRAAYFAHLAVECLVHGTIMDSAYLADFFLLVRLGDVLLSRQWDYTNVMRNWNGDINWYWNWFMSDTVIASNVSDQLRW